MTVLMSFLAICAGLSFAIQGPINTSLGLKTDTIRASLISFFGGCLVMGIAVIIAGTGDMGMIREAEVWQLIGGVYGAVNVCATVATIPVLGVALSITSVMLGQLLASMVIDNFGWFESAVVPISIMRLTGIVIVAFGLILIYQGSIGREGKKRLKARLKKDSPASKEEHFSGETLLMVLFAFSSGILGAMQTPTNSSLSSMIGTLEGTFVSFVAGFIALLIVVLIKTKGHLFKDIRTGLRPWMVTGGAFGAFGIFINILTVVTLGTALQTACCLMGQVAGAVIIDSLGILNVKKIKPDPFRIAGVLVIYAGVIIITLDKSVF